MSFEEIIGWSLLVLVFLIFIGMFWSMDDRSPSIENTFPDDY